MSTHEQVRSLYVTLILAAFFALSAVAFSLESAKANPGGSASPSMSTSRSKSKSTVDVSGEYKKGLAALDAEDYESAEDAFSKVVKARSKDGDARAYLGMSQLGLGDYDDAKKSLEKAIKYDTILPQAHEKLGLVHLYFDEPDQAKQQLAVIVHMDDICFEPCAFEQEIQQAHDALSSAIDSYEGGEPQAHLLSPNGEPNGSYVTAVRHINAGRYGSAIALLLDVDDAHPSNPDVLNYLGFSHRKLGQFDIAVLYYNQALAIDPNHTGANEYLGELYVQLGQIDKAEQQLAKLDQLCSFACAEYEELKSWIDDYKTGG